MDDQSMAPLCRRRAVLKAALGLAPWLISPAHAQDPASAPPQDPASLPPQPGDRLVFLTGPKKGAPIRVDDLELGGPLAQAYPADPSGVVRDGTPVCRWISPAAWRASATMLATITTAPR